MTATWAPAADVPACWTWPVPPVRDLDEVRAALLAEQDGLPVDLQLSPEALEWVHSDAQQVQWLEFHAGAPPASDRPAERCAMCGRRGGPGRWLVDDHDHKTGLVRGLLCHGCNTREGLGRGDLVAAYRDRPPSAILEHRAYYVGRGWPYGWWLNPGLACRLTGNRQWRPPLTGTGRYGR